MHAILTTPAFGQKPAGQGRAPAAAAPVHMAPAAAALSAEDAREMARAERTLAEVCARHLRANQPAARQPRVAVRHAGNPIREARAKAGLSLQKLAARLGITGSCLHYWETDANFIGVDRLRELRAALAPHFDLEAYLAHAERVGRTRVRAERGR